ncbi:hypothetical protein F8S13_26925 [Chloroflexia bacterium SDU3-3]|nr:hypothetical protein F8S13_26925 [Chloroflexia bacterium SDU3-3]
MTHQENINDQMELLKIHRRTIAIYLKQLAMQGHANANIGIFHSLDDTRKSILRIKSILRSWGISIDDHPDDIDHQLYDEISTANNATIKTHKLNLQENINTNQEEVRKQFQIKQDNERMQRFHEQRLSFDLVLRKSMPGAYGFTKAQDKATINRVLSNLATYNKECGLWWYQGLGQTVAQPFYRMENNIWLIWYLECDIIDLWAFKYTTLERQFILLHLAPRPPFGIYKLNDNDRVNEEAGYFNGIYISRGEFDDGFAVIDGQVLEVNNAEIRRRNLRNDFIFLAPELSILNNPENDMTVHEIYKSLLDIGHISPEILEPLRSLKRARWMSAWD